MEPIKIVFLDMDNTINANETCEDVEFTPGMYLNKKPIKLMIEAVYRMFQLNNIPVIIISKVQGGIDGVSEKKLWLSRYMKQSPADCLWLADSNKNVTKAQIIKEVCDLEHYDYKDVLIIDDKKQILQDCLSYGFKVMYPQQVMCEYEEFLFGITDGVI